ncbi:MAG: glycosyltransferase family 2 protein [Candidatus Falkowbacteria bacterium]
MTDKLLSIIVPVYNEEKIAAGYLPSIFNLKLNAEIIIVNDGSTDNTVEVLNKLHENYNFKLINQASNQGKGAAVKRGLEEISGDYFIICDADAEYNPEDIIILFKEIVSCQDEQTVIYGSRFILNKKISFHYLINFFLTSLTNILFGSQLTDMETCFKLMPSACLNKIKLSGRRFEIEPEITAQLLKANYKIIEVPINYQRRSYQDGKKIKARDGLLAIRTLIEEKFKNTDL